MKLISVSAQNFCAIGAETTIPLDLPGLVLVSGNNQDAPKANSNGASKSSIISAICFSLWGECPNGYTADEVVHNKVNKDCRVILRLEDDNGSKISITRTRKDTTSHKANDLILLVNGVDLACSTVEETQKRVDNIIGMDFDTFCALMPGAGTKVAALTDKGIKSLLEKILRTEELSQAHKLANDKHKEAKVLLATEHNTLAEAKKILADLQLKKLTYETNEKTFAKQKACQIINWKNQLHDHEEELSAAQMALTSAGRPVSMTETQGEIRGLSVELKAKNKELAELVKKIQKVTGDYQTKNGGLIAENALIQKTISDFQLLDICPTCSQGVSHEHKESALTEYYERSATLETKIDKLKEDYTKLLAAYTRKQDKLQSEIDNLSSKIQKLQTRADQHLLLCQKYAHLQQEVENKKEWVEADRKSLGEAEAQENVYATLLQEVAANITTYTTKISQSTEIIREMTTKVEMLKFWVDSFSPSGIRSYMLENVSPYLNERAEYYCQVLTDGEMSVVFNTKTTQKSGKEVDKFKIEVSQRHGAHSWKGSSEGEKARANLVISLVLGDLASLRAAKRLNWRIIDEMLDPIDESGEDAVVDLLSKIKDNTPSVYVITHKNSLKDKMPKEIVMAKKNGFSYLQEIKDRD